MLMLIMIEAIYSFGLMFFACELGQRTNDALDECSKMIDQLNWYLFPEEVKRVLPIIINFAQQPIAFYCFGSTACIRETFKYVCIQRQLICEISYMIIVYE